MKLTTTQKRTFTIAVIASILAGVAIGAAALAFHKVANGAPAPKKYQLGTVNVNGEEVKWTYDPKTNTLQAIVKDKKTCVELVYSSATKAACLQLQDGTLVVIKHPRPRGLV